MLADLSILIVEDDEIIARNLGAAVEDRQCVVGGSATSVEEAMLILSTSIIDAAVLDASLLDHNVTPVAMELISRSIPFVIHTGYGLPTELASVFPHVSVIMKPADPDDVIVQLIDQIEKLQGYATENTSIKMIDEAHSSLRVTQIERISSALLRQFGEKALVLAQRQADDAEGEALAAWSEIISKLESQVET